MNEKYFDHHDPEYVEGPYYNGEDPNDYEFERALHKYENVLKTYLNS